MRLVLKECPSAQTMAAFNERRMAQGERVAIVEHLAVCTRCQDLYLPELQTSRTDVPSRQWTPAAAVALVVVLLSAAAAGLRHRPAIHGPAALAQAVADAPFRTVESPLSFSSTYQPLRRDPDSGSPFVDAPDLDARDPHTKAVVRLMSGNARGAVELLEQSIPTQGGTLDFDHATNAALLTDLASAYYEDALREHRPIGLANAFEAAARAEELSPRDPAPKYTRALVLEALSLREDAIDAWKAYLALDASSGWAVEARRHLAGLEAAAPRDIRRPLLAAARANNDGLVRQLVREAPLEARMYVENELLLKWGEQTLGTEPAAAGTLAAAKRIATTLAEVSGDRTSLDGLQRIPNVTGDSLRPFAQAYVAYGEAWAAYDNVRDEATRTLMLTAATQLDACGSPLALRATIYAATITHYAGRNDEALAMLARVLEQLHGKESAYPVAAGQALWTRALIESITGRPHEAVQTYLAASEHFGRTGESSNIAGVETGLSSTWRYLGDAENAWAHGLLALQAAAHGTVYIRKQAAAIDTALSSFEAGRFRLASFLLDRVERAARREHDPIFKVSVLQTRSQLFLRRNQKHEALQQLDLATAEAEAAAPSPTTARMAGQLALARGEVLTQLDPTAAIQQLTFARSRTRELSLGDRQARIDLLLGQARQAAGDPAGAEAELRAGVAAVEAERDHIGDDEERSTFTDTARSLFDATIGLVVEHGSPGEALALARRARTIGVDSGVDAAGLRGAPSETAASHDLLIEYHVLPAELLTWVTWHGSTHMLRKSITQEALEAGITSNVTKIANCSEALSCRESAITLFDLLLKPVGSELAAAESIVIAPDATLHTVPFAALYDSVANRYLIEDHTLTVTLGSGSAPPVSPIHSILVAAAPNPGGGLASLGAVETEARHAARGFTTSRILSGSDVTPAAFLKNAGDYEAVHFAGHALWNERKPELAALRLAPATAQSDGSLYAYEVAKVRFPKTRLVVLAGCDTAHGRLAGVGLLGFTRTFLTAGVPEVIGTLWPAGDQESASIFTDFYRSLSRGLSPAEALRSAQRAAIARSGPSNWATYQLYTRGNH
jgi:CHAT domain-containing protein